MKIGEVYVGEGKVPLVDRLTSTLLLVDFGNILYQGAFVHRRLSYRGKYTGGLYGYITQVVSMIQAYAPKRVVVCLDSKPYLRQKHYEGYKGDRLPEVPKTEEEALTAQNLSASKTQAQQFTQLFGLDLLGKPGLEADDLLAALAIRHKDEYEKIIIVSNDSDLFQLLDQSNLILMRGLSGRSKVAYTRKSLQYNHPYILKASDWAKFLALTGGHNAVYGVPGVGKVRAASWLSGSGNGKDYVERVLSVKGMREVYERNLELATVPYPKIPASVMRTIKVPATHPKAISERDMAGYLGMYGIRITNAMSSVLEAYGY